MLRQELLRQLGLQGCLTSNNPLIRAIANSESLPDLQPSLVNSCDTPWNISPLHLAALFGDPNLIETLLQAGADIHAEDSVGWTALFFSALHEGVECEKILLEQGADRSHMTLRGVSYDLLLEKVGKYERTESMKSTFYIDDKGKAHPLDRAFLARFGIDHYSDTSLFYPESYQLLRHNFSPLAEAADTLFEERAKPLILTRRQTQAYPPLCLYQTQASGWGVYAKEAIDEPLTLVGLYGGKIVPDTVGDKSLYRMRSYSGPALIIDSAKVGNATRFINDDFPNLWVFGFAECDPLFCSLTPIHKGEVLGVNYGVKQAHLKWSPNYTVISIDRMLAYFQKTPLETAIEQIVPDLPEELFVKRFCAYYDRVNKLSYTFNTPLALCTVCLSGLTPVESWIELLQNRSWNSAILRFKENPYHTVWSISLLYLMQQPGAQPTQEWLQGLKKLLSLWKVHREETPTNEKKSYITHPDVDLMDFVIPFLTR